MKKIIFLILSFLLPVLYGCNDKYIWHLHDEKPQTDFIPYDWTHTNQPSGDKDINMIIIDPNQAETEQTTHPEGAPLELNDGKYRLIVMENTDYVSYDGYEVSIESENGLPEELQPFSAGEKEIEIEDGQLTESSPVLMIQQTRELIIKLRVPVGSKRFEYINQCQATLNNVVVSRDILHGFPPQENAVGRDMVEPVCETLKLTLEKEDDSSDSYITYQVRRRLLGLESEGAKISFTYMFGDGEQGGREFFVFDASEAFAEFHTLEDVLTAFVLQIDLSENDVNGIFSISDWATGDENTIIAEEK